jgi:hypothetical protein
VTPLGTVAAEAKPKRARTPRKKKTEDAAGKPASPEPAAEPADVFEPPPLQKKPRRTTAKKAVVVETIAAEPPPVAAAEKPKPAKRATAPKRAKKSPENP